MDFTWENKTVLITGATGSFGTAFCHHLLALEPTLHIRALARDEYKLSVLETSLADHEKRMSYLIGDVRDIDRMRLATRGAHIVVHAAALKRVDLGEYNPVEMIRTNVNGTETVARACIDSDVEQAVFLSSDKAVQPVNAYGMTKALAERAWIQSNSYSPHGTRFACARYGNVMGSRGSVLELFRHCVRAKAPLPVTDQRMTRFWMEMPQAVALIQFIIEQELRGWTVVPVLPAFRILDLCEAIGGQDIKITGIRPGEKLHETLLTRDENNRGHLAPANDDYIGFKPEAYKWGQDNPLFAWRSINDRPALTEVDYRSDVWPLQMSVGDLRERLAQL